MAKVLLTAADIADILGIAESNVPQRIVDWGKKQVENMLGKKYDAVVDAEYEFALRDDSQAYLQLPYMNVTAIDSITYRGLGTTDATEYTITATDYYFEQDTGMIYFNYLLERNYIYKITYTYGGDTIEDLDRQLQFLIVFKYLLSYEPDLFSGDKDIKSEKIGDYAVTYSIQDAKSKPELIDEDIKKLQQIAGAGDNFFLGDV